MKFSVLFFLTLTFSLNSFARESFEIQLGEKVQILSDKAYRSAKNDRFEAVGNVIITYGQDALYGERAIVEFKAGKATVIGNVRYVSATMTMYGSRIDYDFRDKKMAVHNARVLSDNYTVLGKYIARIDENNIEGIDAEYTTCRDCPESWSILGSDVKITLGEYIRIKGAYIKVNGVIVMYVPYIVLPIKKERETGLLFPSISFNYEESILFKQPFFWAISESNDMTISPALYGRRGKGGEFQYRQALGEKSWFELDSQGSFDNIWQPGKLTFDETKTTKFRHFSEYEQHLNPTNNLTHHLYVSGMSDLDMVRDYQKFNESKIRGSDTGIEGFFDYRQDFFNLGVESYFRRNLLFENPKGFDHRYVQVLPRVNFDIGQLELFYSDIPLLNRLTFSMNSDFSMFKQNHLSEGNYIRNARRINAKPRIDWHMGHIGPLKIATSATYDYQGYYFPYEKQGERTFRKSAVLLESEMSLELEKIYGVSYRDSVSYSEIDFKKSKTQLPQKESEEVTDGNLIGKIPVIRADFTEDQVEVVNNAYRHTQIFKLKHYQLADKGNTGNQDFLNQIRADDGIGHFDSIDSLREEEFEKSQATSKTDIPLSNTIELQWNNSLIKKVPNKFNPFENEKYLRDNFSYSRIAYFNISQGLDLNAPEGASTSQRLTRLHLATGLSLGSFGFAANEYYFHDNQEHVFNFSVGQTLSIFGYAFSFNYDSNARPINKYMNLNAWLRPTDLFEFSIDRKYNLETESFEKSTYGVIYSPNNNCWKMEVRYSTDEIQKDISFNFLFNYNSGNFVSFQK